MRLEWNELEFGKEYWTTQKEKPSEISLCYLYKTGARESTSHLKIFGDNQIRHIESFEGHWFIEAVMPEMSDFIDDPRTLKTFLKKRSAAEKKAAKPNLLRGRSFQKGRKYHDQLNGGCTIGTPDEKIEGYWRLSETRYENPSLPFPVIFRPHGFNRKLFLAMLDTVEDLASVTQYKGVSVSRLTCESNGSKEFMHGGWRWPKGYRHYIENGVPPSQAFYNFVMGGELLTLPDYRPA